MTLYFNKFLSIGISSWRWLSNAETCRRNYCVVCSWKKFKRTSFLLRAIHGGFLDGSRRWRLVKKLSSTAEWCVLTVVLSDLMLLCDLETGRTMALLRLSSHILIVSINCVHIIYRTLCRILLCLSKQFTMYVNNICFYSTATHFDVCTSSSCSLLLCMLMLMKVLVPVAARRMASVCGRSLAEIVGSNPGVCMDVCCDCCVLSGRGLCVGLITRPEEFYRLWCVWVWWWNLDNVEALALLGRGVLLLHLSKRNIKKWKI